MTTIRRSFTLLLVFLLVVVSSPIAPARASIAAQANPFSDAQALLDKMSSQERVGQLFLVTFTGSSADENSQIYQLITQYHVGGVVLRAGNDNFVASPNTVPAAYQLISQLQTAELSASQGPASTATVNPSSFLAPTATPSNYIPLFIGISQDGDGYPNDQILEGLTPLPSLMALGATWDPDLTQQVGRIAGQELAALGINLFLGPSLDVLESPGSTLGNGLGASSFGGDPYWVGVMGRAYVTGLHRGSNDRMIVIADHFPGRGSADRPAGGEPATVRKSLEQLKQIELAPYFSVTGTSSNQESTVDGLLVSHIRYQGFQGNIRATTLPVSFDPQALTQILTLPEFSSWRESGGLMVSDDLGSQTVRSIYDPGGQTFVARLVARDAFLAGNDLLFMGNIVSSDAPDNFTTITRAIDFFSQKYLEDPAFALRVDNSVLRILAAKYRQYGEFSLESVIPSNEGLAEVGKEKSVIFNVAQNAGTLVSPALADLASVFPVAPRAGERIVFLTDARTGSQCSTCGEQSMLAVNALQNVILRLYGIQAGGQVQGDRLISYTFTSLGAILEGGSGDSELEGSIRAAGWVIINMLDAEPGEPQTTVLKRFLSERQDLLRDKRIIVFAFNAPYYLDATDISKLTAYYCLYSKSEPFIEAAARLLFKEMPPVGSLPVSVPGIGYDLFIATTPDPDQVIDLTIELASISAPTASNAPEPTATPSFKVGDTVFVKTGVILDHNGNPVPDGTGVSFRIALTGENAVVQQLEASSVDGIAGVTFSIDRPGLLEISATSDPALISVVIQLNVTGEGFSVTIIAPTPVASVTPQPEILPTPTVKLVSPVDEGYPGMSGWLTMFFTLAPLGLLAGWLGKQVLSKRWAYRWGLCLVLGGISAYTYLAVRLPGAANYLSRYGWSGIILIVLLGSVLGSLAAFTWWQLAKGSTKQSD